MRGSGPVTGGFSQPALVIRRLAWGIFQRCQALSYTRAVGSRRRRNDTREGGERHAQAKEVRRDRRGPGPAAAVLPARARRRDGRCRRHGRPHGLRALARVRRPGRPGGRGRAHRRRLVDRPGRGRRRAGLDRHRRPHRPRRRRRPRRPDRLPGQDRPGGLRGPGCEDRRRRRRARPRPGQGGPRAGRLTTRSRRGGAPYPRCVPYDVAAVRARFPALAEGAAHFDGPGGTQTPADVAEAVAGVLTSAVANRGTVTPAGRRADDVVRAARQAVADLLGADPRGVVFGRSMTALTFDLSRTLAAGWRPGDEVVVTSLDHDANVRPWVIAAERAGATVRWAE